MTNLEDFRDIYKDKIGFVLGSGYSLKNWNLNNIINKGISFSCNGSIIEIDRSDYYMLTDGIIPYYNYFDKASLVCDNMIFASKGWETTDCYNKNVNGYNNPIEVKSKKYQLNRRYHDANNTDFNIKDGLLICGSDVCHVATHFAYICGCNPIILIGIDLNWDGDKKYSEDWGDDSMIQKINSPHKITDYPDYYNKQIITNGDKTIITDAHLLTSYSFWENIKKTNGDINIKNTNPNGRLNNLFETIDLKKYE